LCNDLRIPPVCIGPFPLAAALIKYMRKSEEKSMQRASLKSKHAIGITLTN